jgi:hypothetical protein
VSSTARVRAGEAVRCGVARHELAALPLGAARPGDDAADDEPVVVDGLGSGVAAARSALVGDNCGVHVSGVLALDVGLGSALPVSLRGLPPLLRGSRRCFMSRAQ